MPPRTLEGAEAFLGRIPIHYQAHIHAHPPAHLRHADQTRLDQSLFSVGRARIRHVSRREAGVSQRARRYPDLERQRLPCSRAGHALGSLRCTVTKRKRGRTHTMTAHLRESLLTHTTVHSHDGLTPRSRAQIVKYNTSSKTNTKNCDTSPSPALRVPLPTPNKPNR